MVVVRLVLLHSGSLEVVQCVGGRPRMFVCCGREISPALILMPIYSIKKTKTKETGKGSIGLNTGELQTLL